MSPRAAQHEKPKGWYLGLRYMHGAGLVAEASAPVEERQFGAQFIFAGEILCEAADWRALLRQWWEAIRDGGTLVLWVPDCRFLALAPEFARITREDIEHAFDDMAGWCLREADLIDGHIFAAFEKTGDGAQRRAPWRTAARHVLVARTGALGDALMAASVLPALKAEGWHISFISKAPGCTALRHDPHIDELILLQDGQVSDAELPLYWQAHEGRFDRFINLTHSVEGELLKHPGRGDYWWSDAQRRALCGRSYLAQTHAVAGAPPPFRVRFYPSNAEVRQAAAQAQKLGDFVLWCLRGSAVHKWWPHAPQAICQLLAKTNLTIVLSGDSAARRQADEIIAAARAYHGDAARVIDMAGTHSVRAVMALAHHARAVVGPETGVMHAVCMEDVPKIAMLSHSSPANLTDDWVNAIAITPDVACYPCHRLHYGHEWCPQDDATGAAACAAAISPARVSQAVREAVLRPVKAPWWNDLPDLAA
ncbi:MAG: hypothetical protein GC131_09010 [Alphaproteobacteria bacterium]|nr:hypothetical protein [Alphaproteobacteria bacterium]